MKQQQIKGIHLFQLPTNNFILQVSQTESQSQTQPTESSKSEGTQAGGTLAPNTKSSSTSTRPPLRENMHHVLTNTKSVDYSDIDMMRDAELRATHHHNVLNNNISNRRNKSKSTEDMNRENGQYRIVFELKYENGFFFVIGLCGFRS